MNYKELKVKVAGRVMTMFVPPGDEGTPQDNSPHTSYALGRTDIARELTAFRWIIDGLKADSVCELFGGSGWHAASIQELIKPTIHAVKDIDASCIESIRKSLPEVFVEQVDSYEYARTVLGAPLRGNVPHEGSAVGIPVTFDLVHADFNQYTIMRGAREKLYKGVLERIFKASRKYTLVTDSAVYGVRRFPKNRNAYSAFFQSELSAKSQGRLRHLGVIDDVADYYEAASSYYAEKFQRVIVKVGIWEAMSSLCLLVPGTEPRPIQIEYAQELAEIELQEST